MQSLKEIISSAESEDKKALIHGLLHLKEPLSSELLKESSAKALDQDVLDYIFKTQEDIRALRLSMVYDDFSSPKIFCVNHHVYDVFNYGIHGAELFLFTKFLVRGEFDNYPTYRSHGVSDLITEHNKKYGSGIETPMDLLSNLNDVVKRSIVNYIHELPTDVNELKKSILGLLRHSENNYQIGVNNPIVLELADGILKLKTFLTLEYIEEEKNKRDKKIYEESMDKTYEIYEIVTKIRDDIRGGVPADVSGVSAVKEMYSFFEREHGVNIDELKSLVKTLQNIDEPLLKRTYCARKLLIVENKFPFCDEIASVIGETSAESLRQLIHSISVPVYNSVDYNPNDLVEIFEIKEINNWGDFNKVKSLFEIFLDMLDLDLLKDKEKGPSVSGFEKEINELFAMHRETIVGFLNKEYEKIKYFISVINTGNNSEIFEAYSKFKTMNQLGYFDFYGSLFIFGEDEFISRLGFSCKEEEKIYFDISLELLINLKTIYTYLSLYVQEGGKIFDENNECFKDFNSDIEIMRSYLYWLMVDAYLLLSNNNSISYKEIISDILPGLPSEESIFELLHQVQRFLPGK